MLNLIQLDLYDFFKYFQDVIFFNINNVFMKIPPVN